MNWLDVIPGSILGLREGLEAFLIVGIMMKYLEKSGRDELKRSVKAGMGIGIAGSIVAGLALFGAVRLFGGSSDNAGKLWETVASMAGLALLSTFVYWMMKHGRTVTNDIQGQVDARISKAGITTLATVVVLREGVEIALFAFSSVSRQAYVLGIAVGLIAAAVLARLIYRSLVRVNLPAIFSITLAYLVLQAGFLLGYSVHEFLSAMKGLGHLAAESPIYIKAFNLSGTVLDHSKGALGVPLNVLAGWYSRPEWIQLVLHYGYVALMFILWKIVLVRQTAAESRIPADIRRAR
jgi:high-affinity iron transporter